MMKTITSIALALTVFTAQAAEVKSFSSMDTCFDEEVKSSVRAEYTEATSPSGEYRRWSAMIYKGKMMTFDCFVDNPTVTIETKQEYKQRVSREKKEFLSKK